ncbi:adhesion G-protein coupled receptor G2 [Clupea harengus]|uniref:Adhesion G-protein coupled receptor G2 n=1 Tax=Clupea harengus TaxID=7950 RepID=A0A6P8GQQ7_CLUHA|nr:adhesion G-protein coupled receptor G2 [Clupea harengus]XP_042566215.1 adhesion G-protein coupled receptor G2 [Clupea harengus]
MLPLNSTQFNTTDVPQDIIQFTTSTQNSTLFNSTTVWWNETLFNTTTPPLKTINSTTTTTWNSTEFNTTPLQLNTTQMYTTINESLQNVTHINTTAFPATAKQSDTTGIPKNSSDFTTAVVSPTSSPNITDTTPLQLNTTQMYTTINESLQNVTHINTNAWPANATQSATTHTPLNSSDFTTAVVSPTSSPNITTSSPQLNTTELFTAPSSYLNTTWDYNATAFPLTTASASQNTSSLPVEVNTNTGTNGSLTSNYTTGHVLNQTVAPATTSEQKLTSQYNNTVVPDRTATLTTTTTTTTTQSTARPPDPVEPSLTTIATIPTETTTTTMTTTSSPGEQADQLLDQTKDVSALNSSQVADVVNQLEKLLSSPNVSLEVGRAMVSVISNLLNASASSLGSSSKRLIKAVDTLALKLIVEQGNQTIVADSLVLSVNEIDGNIFNGGSFSVAINPNQQRSQASIRRRRRSERESTLAEGDLAMITLPSTLTENLSPQQLKEVSRVQFNFYSKTTLFQDGSLDQRRLNSRVLSGSMSNLSISNLTEGVEIILKNDNPIPENGTAVCVFWDLGKNGGAGGWSSEGCFVKNTTTASETICSCNHLTSFAVLLDVSREGITDRQQATVLSFITYIGCGISAIFLSITLLTYISFEKIRRDIPSKILIQLCLALLMLNLVFLLDSWLALYPDAVGLCISTAFFLHYFLLASFTWMALEALHMYLAIVKVFNSYVSRYMLKFSLMGWGIPLPVVIIVISVDTNNYGLITYGKYTDGTTDDFCWLKNDIAFYVGVVAYFCLVFVLNLAMFMVVMVQLKRIKRQNPHNNQHRSSLHDLRSVAGLTFLLGLTWSFAFFAWGPVKLAFMYLFAIFNSLQGFFIFVFHCALKDNVRRQWRMYLCCGRLRLAENSDWSNTATKTTTKKTSLATTSSVHSSISALTHRASRDSFVTGDVLEHSNGIRSPLEDSVITALEDSHGDVVLNEISHRQSSTRLQ